MSALDLYKSRKALAAGVGLSTRRNKVLPFASVDQPIPARVGKGVRPLPACLLGPIIETYMSERTYHADTTTIRSPDYVFHIVVKHLQKVKCTRNGVATGTDIDLYFSSPATNATSVVSGSTDYICESAYSTRTYHPEVLIAPLYSRGAMLHMIMERFNALSMNRDAPFTWSFAKVGGTVWSGTYTACLNRISVESDIASRTYHATYKGVTKFVMQNNDKFWDLRPAEYGGWLGPSNYANGPSVTHTGFVSTYFEGGTVQVGSMAKIKAMGQPYHGLIEISISPNTVNMTLPDATVISLPVGAFYIIPDAFARKWMGDTYYFKHPSAPAPTTPSSVSAVHGQFYNDAIFYGIAREYGLNGRGLNPGPYAVGDYDGDWLVVDDAGDVLRSTMKSQLISGSSYNLKFQTFGKIRPVDLAITGGGLARNNTGPTPGVVAATDSGINLPVALHSYIVWSNNPRPDGRKIIVAVEDKDNPDRSDFYEVDIASTGLATGYTQLAAAGTILEDNTVVGTQYTSGARSIEHILLAGYETDGTLNVARLTAGWQYTANSYGRDHPYGKHLQVWYQPEIDGPNTYVDIVKAVVTFDDGTTWTCPEYYEPEIKVWTNNVVGMVYKNAALVKKIVFIAPGGNVSAAYDYPGDYFVTYNPRTNVLHISVGSNIILQCT